MTAGEAQEAFRGKNVLVVGLARSGIGAANLLSALGANVQGTDIRSHEILKENISRLQPSVRVHAGGHAEALFSNSDLIVVSPGVPLSIPQIINARSRGVPVIGELELAYRAIVSGKDPASKIIGITGTNGKSTTATLIYRMLKHSGYTSLLGGNIGNALTDEICKTIHELRPTPFDYIVAEVSSFQLESIVDFKPDIGVILNISPDHLDRYAGMEEYIHAKAMIYKNQGAGDYLILNADDPVIMELYNSGLNDTDSGLKHINTLFFSRDKEVNGICLKNGNLFLNTHSTPRAAPSAFLRKQEEGAVSSPLEIIAQNEIRLEGTHNLENVMAASLAAIISGCTVGAIRGVLRDFSGLEHRLEPVRDINGVRFINDSKGTNVGATAKSLESFKNIILIMGGRDKGSDFSVLKGLIRDRVKTLLLIGESRERIAGELGGITETLFVHDMKEAVDVSISKAVAGDVVLLSPGCASYDMFADFGERGNKFKELVMGIRHA
jgi:UDP-N-acetylmuramoylalanine--D-glutamate ligase